MEIYWLFFLFPATLALVGKARDINVLSKYQSLNIGPLWWLVVFALTMLIGLRYVVGGDWKNYIRLYNEFLTINSLADLELSRDPGFQFINYLSKLMGFYVYGVNLICGFIFSIGLAVFCRSLPRPLLALAVAVPFLVVVVSMGYTRQATALGLAMIGLVSLVRGRKLSFVLWIILAITIHKSAILLLPISVLASTKDRFWGVIWVGVIGILFFTLLIEDSYRGLLNAYSNLDDPASQSSGAFIRLTMNIVPSILFLFYYKRFNLPELEKPLWRLFSLISIILMGIYFMIPVSSALDRVALYMIPLQMVVFSYLPDIFGTKYGIHRWIILFIICYYGLVLFVWLNYATHSHYWVPYNSLIFNLL